MSIELNRYLGDGVYAEFKPCSVNIVLRTGSHKPEEANNTIVMEPSVIDALVVYVKQLYDLEEDAYAKLMEDSQEDQRSHAQREAILNRFRDHKGPGEY